MTGITEFGYIVYGVKNMARWKKFATEFLGLEYVEGETPKRAYLKMDFWHHRFILEEDDIDDVVGIGLRVAGGDEFAEMSRTLTANGVAHRICSKEEAEARHVLELMKLEDSLGNPLEIFHGPLVEFNKPFLPSRRMYGSFSTGSGGLGHCMLSGTDLPAARKFYSMLGMRGDVEYKVEMAPGKHAELLFMHCNDRDHTIAFGFPGRKRLSHVMIESTSFDDVAQTYALAEHLKVPVAVTLGRHSNDHEYSFYFMTPSGFMMEYGWGSRTASHQTEYYNSDFYGHAFQPNIIDADWNAVGEAAE